MLKVAIGHSNDPDSLSAIEEVIAQCQETLAGIKPQAGILFAAIDFDHALILQRIRAAFSGIELIGCTTDGEISPILGFQQDSIMLTLFCSDEIEIHAGVGRNVSHDAIAAAKQAVQQSKCSRPAQLCLTLPESLTTSGVAILNSLKTVLGQDFPIYGGLAAEEWQFKATYQFYQTEVLRDALPMLLFSGTSLKFSHGVASGFQPISAAGRATKVDQNVLYEIDGKPALTFYRDYFNKLDPSPEHPFAVFDETSNHFYLRGFSGFDPVVGSITTFADIPDQATLKIATASRDDILAASKRSILEALENYPGAQPEVALFISCASRRKLLGTRARDEYQLIQECLSPTIATCGFYSYGEFAPLGQQHETQLHQDTLVTLLLGTQ